MSNTLKFGNGEWYGKKDTILAYNDENNNYKPLLFNFGRATSATRVNKQGLIEVVGSGEPRVDYLNDANGALLLEPQRTNLVTYSEQFDNAAWTNLADASVVTNAAFAPDGTMSADKLVENTATAQHRIYRSISGASNTFSVFAKSDNRNYIGILANNGTRTYFNLSNGTIGSVSSGSTANIENHGNGWYRCTLYNSHPTFGAMIQLSDNGTNDSYLGDGTSGVYIWGAQLEAGSYATSYIPTQGSQVTRVQDVCNNAGNDQVINSTEGVLYLEAKVKTDDIFAANCIAVSDGTDTNRLLIIMYGNINSIRASMNVGGVSQFDFNLPSGYIQEQYYKIAVSYKVNDCKIFINGTKILTDTSATMPSTGTFNRLNFDLANGLYDFYGNVKEVKLYNTALTDQELQQLTTL